MRTGIGFVWGLCWVATATALFLMPSPSPNIRGHWPLFVIASLVGVGSLASPKALVRGKRVFLKLALLLVSTACLAWAVYINLDLGCRHGYIHGDGQCTYE